MRNRYRTGCAACLLVVIVATCTTPALCAEAMRCNPKRPSSPAAAVKALLEGNVRWATGTQIHPGNDVTRRECVAREGQTPFAAILSCADSRVPPELLFDEGVGDLFVVRVAGNSLDQLGEQSLEYAAEHLGVATIMVLGHQQCGAVKGAVDTYPAAAPEFLSLIYPAVQKAVEVLKGRGGNPNDKEAVAKESIDQHIILEVHKLRADQPFAEMIAKGKLKIVGGRYDLDSGRVTMLIE